FDFEDEEIGFADTAASYRLIAGYNVHETLAVELGFGKSGGFREALAVPGWELALDVDYDVTTIRVLLMAPFNGIDMFGGIGFYDGEVKFKQTLRGQGINDVQTLEKSVSGGTIIGGVQFHLDRLIIRGEYEWFDDDKDVATQALNFGVIFPFGRR